MITLEKAFDVIKQIDLENTYDNKIPISEFLVLKGFNFDDLDSTIIGFLAENYILANFKSLDKWVYKAQSLESQLNQVKLSLSELKKFKNNIDYVFALGKLIDNNENLGFLFKSLLNSIPIEIITNEHTKPFPGWCDSEDSDICVTETITDEEKIVNFLIKKI
jgi:hypothetical protein